MRIGRAPRLRGDILVPGDKSICHRAMILAAVSSGVSEIRNVPDGADCMSTAECLGDLGAGVFLDGKTCRIRGGLSGSNRRLNAGNSGTTMRLLSGVLAWQPFESSISGDESLSSRPMGRIARPLRRMGADMTCSESMTAPLFFRPSRLRGAAIAQETPSAQVKSCVLLAGLGAEGITTYSERVPTRDHLERLLSYSGARITSSRGSVSVEGGAPKRPFSIELPGDFSSAAFIITAAVTSPDAVVTIRNVGLNPLRTGLLDALLRMGADITVANERLTPYGEPVGDITAASSRLTGTTAGPSETPSMIDELPLLAVAGASARGETVITGAAELRKKETDRIRAMAMGLSMMGAAVTELPDGLKISGGQPLRCARVSSMGDHRIAMALSVAAMSAGGGETEIEGGESAGISFPGFYETIRQITRSQSC